MSVRICPGSCSTGQRGERSAARDGVGRVQFSVRCRDSGEAVYCGASVIDRRVVRDSGGHDEERYVTQTDLQIGGKHWPIEVTLTDRGRMSHAMLIGRSALKSRFLVDAGRSYLLEKGTE